MIINQRPTTRRSVRQARSVADLVAPLEKLAEASPSVLSRPLPSFEVTGASYFLPRYLFVGPKGGDDPIRIALFAGIHGDEPEGARALVQFISLLDASPELAKDYFLFIYPVCNPSGYEFNTRYSRRGRDLNREFWNHSSEPEVLLLQSELCAHAFDGIISLHSDDTTDGVYGFVSGATLTKHLLEPALRAAGEILPRNHESTIDGFRARNGIIKESYRGIISAPPRVLPRPFEIVLETPQRAPAYLQETASVVALISILSEYRTLAAYRTNI